MMINNQEQHFFGLAELIRCAESAAADCSTAIANVAPADVQHIAEVMADGYVYQNPDQREHHAEYRRLFYLAFTFYDRRRNVTIPEQFQARCGCQLPRERALTGLRLGAIAICPDHDATRVVAF